jgi:hypothetical protein
MENLKEAVKKVREAKLKSIKEGITMEQALNEVFNSNN